MSKYFQVLERLERGRPDTLVSRLLHGNGRGDGTEDITGAESTEDGRAARLAAARVATSPAVAFDLGAEAPDGALGVEAPAKPADLRKRPWSTVDARRVPALPGVLPGIDALFNNIEARAKGQRPVTVVLAGASATDSVHAVAMSLARYAERRGQCVLVAELGESDGCGIVRRRYPVDGEHAAVRGAPENVQIDLRNGADREALTRWRDSVRPGADIMLVVGPPLEESLDAALLASLCTGLVIVAVEGKTSRAALTVAAERAGLTNAPTFGVVVAADRDEMPPWLRGVLRPPVARSAG